MRKTSRQPQAAGAPWPAGEALRGEPAGTTVRSRCPGGPGTARTGHSGTQGGRQDPGTSGGRGLSAEHNTGTGKDQSREPPAPSGQRKTAGQGRLKPRELNPGPWPLSGGGSVAGMAQPWADLAVCRRASERGQWSPVWALPGDGCPLGLGGCSGLARAPDRQGSATASPAGAQQQTCGAPQPLEGASGHSASWRGRGAAGRGRWGLKSPGVESRGSGQRVQRCRLPPCRPLPRGRQRPGDPRSRLARAGLPPPL